MDKKIRIIEPVKTEKDSKAVCKKRVCAYCRVSTELDRQNSSYTAQSKHYEEYIKANKTWEFAGIYADESSGTKIKKRDGFLDMISDCEDGKIDMIITKSITRFARNTVDGISVIRKLKSLGIEVYFEKEKVGTLSQQSEILLTILSATAQRESENISENCRWGISKKFREGTYNVSCIAYGYRKDEEGNLIPEEKEAEIVRVIFKKYLEGVGAYTIARYLDDKNIKTVRNAKKWHANVIIEIIKNPIYKGDLLLQKTYTTETMPFTKKVNRGQKKKYLVEDNHEAIISKEDFKRANELCELRKHSRGSGSNKSFGKRYELTGKIICKECGSKFRRQKINIGKPEEYIRWSCRNHIESMEACKVKSVREEDIQKAFIKMWNKLLLGEREILRPIIEILESRKDSFADKEKVQDIENKIKEITRQSQILMQTMQRGNMDSAIFISKKNELDSELKKLKMQNRKTAENSICEC